jgi:hypothetical protein
MMIPEACQLILQAGAMGDGGEIFILEMARREDRRHGARHDPAVGKVPDQDIQIVTTGLRAGRKALRELITQGEGIVATAHEKIMVLKRDGHGADSTELDRHVRRRSTDWRRRRPPSSRSGSRPRSRKSCPNTHRPITPRRHDAREFHAGVLGPEAGRFRLPRRRQPHLFDPTARAKKSSTAPGPPSGTPWTGRRGGRPQRGAGPALRNRADGRRAGRRLRVCGGLLRDGFAEALAVPRSAPLRAEEYSWLHEAPRALDLSLTGRCNLRCAYCFYADEMLPPRLARETLAGLFPRVGRPRRPHPDAERGELFLRPDLWELLDALVAARCAMRS